MSTSHNSVKSLLIELRNKLAPIYDLREAENISALVVEEVLGMSRMEQLQDKKIPVNRQQLKNIDLICQRLLKHEPIQYILGHCFFYGRRFQVDRRVLIPRMETEELVRWVIDAGHPGAAKILDIGTGSGCMAITLALEAGCDAYALDMDPQALEVAKINALNLGAQVNFVEADILHEEISVPTMDIILSNPPYVPRKDLSTISKRVKDHEPHHALFVPKKSPLLFYQRMASKAYHWLAPGGQLFLEIYHEYGPAIEALFNNSLWSQVIIKKDLQGKDRMVRVIKN